MLNNLLNQEELSQTEKDIVIETFSNPTVKKFLRTMGQNDLAELAVLPISEWDNSVVAKKHSLIQGKLSTLVTLLNINKE